MDSKIKKGLVWASLFSLCFMGFLLYRVEWRHFPLIGERLDPKYLIIACIIFIGANLIRTWRFHTLDHTENSLLRWWNINQCYNLVNATLPGGPGEAVTAYILKRLSMFNILTALRILILSRLMDLASLSALFLFSAVQINIATPFRQAAIWLSIALCIISIIGLVPAIEQFILSLMHKFSVKGAIMKKIRSKLNELIEISKDQQGKKSLIIYLLQSLLFMAGLAFSVHFSLGSFGIDFSPVQSLFCFGFYSVFKMVPVQGLAGIGTQAAWWSLSMNAAGYQGPDSIAMGFVMYGTYYVFIALTGLPSIFLLLRGQRKAVLL